MRNIKWLNRIKNKARKLELELIEEGKNARAGLEATHLRSLEEARADAAFNAAVTAKIKSWNSRIRNSGSIDADVLQLAYPLEVLARFPEPASGPVSASALSLARQIVRRRES